jgi:hypothetical protein
MIKQSSTIAIIPEASKEDRHSTYVLEQPAPADALKREHLSLGFDIFSESAITG